MLEQARRREERRQEALRRITAARPPAPEGRLAVLKQRAHQQALAAWDRSRLAAWKLAKQAQRLAERLREQLIPERIRNWATALVQRNRPEAYSAYEREQELLKREAEVVRATVREKSGSPSAERSAWPKNMDEQGRRDWIRFHELRLAEQSRPLDLAERREFAKGWDQQLRHVESGNLSAPTSTRNAFQVLRQSAHRKLHAAVFQALPPVEGCREHPELAGAYALEAAIGKQLEVTGFNAEQRQRARERARQTIAAAIETGKYPDVQMRETIEVRREPEAERSLDRPRER